jgi:uncharacterized membrane protein YkgB
VETRKTDPEWEAAFAKLSATHPEIRPGPAVDPGAIEKADREAGWSLGLGLVSIPTVVLGIGALLGIVALVLGMRAISGQTEHRGRAGIGIASGLIALLIAIAIIAWLATDPLAVCPC